jgi:hypothetical protein
LSALRVERRRMRRAGGVVERRAEIAMERCARVGGLKEESRIKRRVGAGWLGRMGFGIVCRMRKVEGEVVKAERAVRRAGSVGSWNIGLVCIEDARREEGNKGLSW